MCINWVAVQTVILFLTGVVVAFYTVAAFRQVAVGQRQLEALQTPCLVPSARPQTSDDPDRERAHQDVYAFALRIRNIGNGPAINARYQLKKSPDSWDGDTDGLPCEAIGPGTFYEDWDVKAPTLPNPVYFRVRYQSLSGRRYETEAKIVDQRRTEYVRFRPLPGPTKAEKQQNDSLGQRSPRA